MKETQNNTEKKDRGLKKSFRITHNTATVGVIVCLLSLLLMFLCLKLWRETNVEWYRNIGLTSFGAAFVAIIVGFASQSANQVVRHVAHKRGKGPDFFREYQRPSLLRQIVGHFAVQRHVVKPAKISRSRSNARSYRRAPRPAFAHASRVSRGSPGCSGDPDSGDPPELPSSAPQRPSVTTPFRQFQPNNTSIPWRAPVHGACPAAHFRAQEVI